MDLGHVLAALLAGFVVALVTAPVGVSGAVFLLPVHLDLLHVPSPRVTPTNLLFNVVATPGALARYLRSGPLHRGLAGQLLTGTVPGVVVGAVLRVHAVPDDRTFRLLAAVVLAPVGMLVLMRARRPPRFRPDAALPRPLTLTLAFVVGVVGGVYGIGGGALLGPVLVGLGLTVATVAPATLLSTLVTSVVGVATFAALGHDGSVPLTPDWGVGLACGIGGAAGGYLGARLQPRLPETALRTALGVLALALAAGYAAVGVTG